jgi:NAD+ synthase (glutamine-hydrolysing)
LSAAFFNFFNHGFVRVAVAIPEARVADPKFNVERTIALMHEAAESAASLVVFPDLGLSSYTCDDLFHQESRAKGKLQAQELVHPRHAV